MTVTRRRWVGAIALLILVVFIVIFVLIRFQPPVPQPNGVMLITLIGSGTGRSNWLDVATGEVSPVGGDPYWDLSDLSPSGDQVAYSGFPGLFIYDLTSDSVEQITDGERDNHPIWSPDGQNIIFVNSRDFRSALFRYDIASGERQQLTDYQNDLEPDWSPDGQRIVFTTSRDGFQELYTMRPDGNDLQRLTNNTGQNDLRAAYSPDGQYIVYTTNYSVNDGSSEIWLMNADGSNQHAITDNDRDDLGPTWSPDSRQIAFNGETSEGDHDIFVYDVTNQQLRQITTLSTSDVQPIWSPDGEWIAFVAYEENGQDDKLYLVRPHGSDLHVLMEDYKGYPPTLWMSSLK